MTQISLPSAITVRRYRCFVEPTRLELRPITLLFGVNNSGKSALLRLLPLLADSSGPQSPPLNLESPAARGAGFADLQCKLIEGSDESRDLGISLEWERNGDVATYEAAFHYVDDWKRLLVRRLRLFIGTNEDRFDWTFRAEERVSPNLTYEWRSPKGPAKEVDLNFMGLSPIGDGLAPVRPILEFLPRLQAIQKRVQWLEATRHLPTSRLNRRPNRPRWLLQSNGEDAADALAADPELLAEVSAWYEKVNHCSLKVRDLPGDYFKLVLEHRRKASFEVDIADSGEGLAQLLPILTALALGRRSEQGGPRILAIEEPESHLHPELQMHLAEYISKRIAERPDPYLILETHSQHLLLGVQLQVVLGNLDPQQVVIYWVRQRDDGSSVIDRIGLDALGRPTGDALPPGVFKEDLKVSRLIVEERLRREGIEF